MTSSRLFPTATLLSAALWSCGSTALAGPQLGHDSWEDQITSLESVKPKLKSKDKELHGKVFPHILNNPALSISEIQKASASERSPVFDFVLGTLLHKQGETVSAIEALKLAIKKHPNFRQAHRSLASVYSDSGQLDEGREHAIKAISLGGADGILYGILAEIHYEKGDYTSALSAYRMAKTLSLSNTSVYQRGELFCLVRIGEHEKVVELSKEMIQRHPNDKKLWTFQANARLALDDNIGAMTTLEIMRQKGLAQPDSLLLLGQLAYNQDLLNYSTDIFVEALKNGAKSSRLVNPFQILVNRGEYDQAQKLHTTISKSAQISEIEKDIHWKFAVVELNVGLGHEKMAIEQLLEVVEQWPTHGSAIMMLARHYLNEGNVDEAQIYYKIAANIEEVQTDAWYQLGRLAYNDGDVSKAFEWLSKVNGEKPSVKLETILARLQDQL